MDKTEPWRPSNGTTQRSLDPPLIMRNREMFRIESVVDAGTKHHEMKGLIQGAVTNRIYSRTAVHTPNPRLSARRDKAEAELY